MVNIAMVIAKKFVVVMPLKNVVGSANTERHKTVIAKAIYSLKRMLPMVATCFAGVQAFRLEQHYMLYALSKRIANCVRAAIGGMCVSTQNT